MHVIPLHEHQGARTYALIFETGDEPISTLTKLAGDHGWRASRFTGIGAFRDAELAYFNWDTKAYERLRIDEQVEVLSLTGHVSVSDGAPAVHAHVVIGMRDGSARGGHLMAAHVRPTLEVTIVDAPAALERRTDEESGLPLIVGATR